MLSQIPRSSRLPNPLFPPIPLTHSLPPILLGFLLLSFRLTWKEIRVRFIRKCDTKCGSKVKTLRVEKIPLPNCLPSRENKRRIMGKVSPKDGQSKTPKQKRRSKSTRSKYLRPGALAQFRNTKVSAAKCCTDLWKKRVAVRNADDANDEVVLPNDVNDESPIFLTPMKFPLGAVTSPMDLAKQNNLQMTPKTPGAVEGMSESRLESLPLDLLVNILCHLQHDQLKAVFHVSQKIRKAVILARQLHFNYTTPYKIRQDMSGTMTPLLTDHWPFASKGDEKGACVHSPRTPQAPKHGPKPPSRLKFIEMEQIATALFQESAFPSRCLVPSVIPKPLCKSLGSNRVLFYEDELCQAVSQNRLR